MQNPNFFFFFFFTYLKEEVDLLPGGADQTVKLVQPLDPVLQAQKRILSAVLPVKDRHCPGPHAALHVLHIVFGSLKSARQVAN